MQSLLLWRHCSLQPAGCDSRHAKPCQTSRYDSCVWGDNGDNSKASSSEVDGGSDNSSGDGRVAGCKQEVAGGGHAVAGQSLFSAVFASCQAICWLVASTALSLLVSPFGAVDLQVMLIAQHCSCAVLRMH